MQFPMPHKSIKLKQIEHLMAQKFPAYRAVMQDADATGILDELYAMRDRMAAYRSELNALSAEEVGKLHAKSKPSSERGNTAGGPRATENPQTLEDRFLKSLTSTLDYPFWAKMPRWTAEEAVALTLGISPSAAGNARLKTTTARYAIVATYKKFLKLVRRAEAAGCLNDGERGIVPAIYLAWAKQNDVNVPPDLQANVARYAKTRKPQAEAKPLMTRERETFLKILLGMALGGYGYNPSAAKSSTTKEIYDDLARRGIAVDEDTIRKKLKEASQIVGADVLSEGK